MSNENQTNKPNYRVSYPVRDGRIDRWHNIGAAWQRDDGRISLSLDGQPLAGWNGTIILHPIEEEGAQ